MQAPLPPDEAARLEALRQYDILDTAPEEAFDDLADLAAHLCEAPIALISFIDENRQWFKSRVGWALEKTSREVAFCAHTILLPDILVVPDTLADERFADNPLVTSDPHLRFYAGAPLISSEGHALGTLCVLDRKPREFSPERQQALRVLSRHVTALLELRRSSAERARVDAGRRRAEEALRKAQERLQHLVSSSPAVIYSLKVQSDALLPSWVSDNIAQMTGHEPQEALAPTWWLDHLHPEDRGRILAEIPALFAKGRLTSEYRFRRKDGTYLWVRNEMRLLREAGGTPAEVVGSWSDITERRMAEEEIRQLNEELERRVQERTAELEAANNELYQSRQMLQTILDNIPQRVFWKDRDLRYLGCNIPFAQDAGLDGPEAILGKDDFALSWKETAELYRADDKFVVENDAPKINFEEPQRRPDGAQLWLRTSKVPLHDRNGTVIGVLGTYEDITFQKQAEQALRENEERFRATFEQAAVGMAHVSPDGRWLLINQRLCDILGYPLEELLQKAFQDITHPDDLPTDLENVRKMLAGQIQTFAAEKRYIRKDGSHVWVHLTVSLVRKSSGEPDYFIAVVEDVTQRKQLERQLFQAQKMEAIGTLAGGIAHDFNNMLTGMIGFTQLALLEPDDSTQWRQYIAKIPEQGQRAAKLISQLLTFSRQAATDPQPMSLASLAKETAKMLERTVPESVAIRLDVPRQIALIDADPTQMQQVLLNLCVNASHAMPEGGELTLRLENAVIDEAYCRQYPYAKPGNYVCLSVRDTGTGMTPEVMERIFEPFFTTKESGKGTGLGLSMVYGIVKEHKGHINVYSEVGKGSEFKVYLPAMDTGTPFVATYTTQERPAGGTETLLMVEDDDTVLRAGREMLERLGYTVLTATNGVDALKTYYVHQNKIALVLTDMVMPRMGGQELYKTLVEINPSVKVLAMTGYSLKQEIADLRASGVKGIVQKPFDFQSLGRAVRQALDG